VPKNILYKRLHSSVQKKSLFCTEDCNLLYKGIKSIQGRL
jgi:hypothetical protein